MLKPLGNRAVVKPIETKSKVEEAGFILPDSVDTKDKPLKFTVEAIGSGEDILELALQVGDTVVVNKYAGTSIIEDGVEYKIVLCNDIQAVVE